jgi:hypothetical protein
MATLTASQWAALLRAVAAPVATRPPQGPGDIGEAFSAAVAAGPVMPSAPANVRDLETEVVLWWALADDRVDVEGLVCPRGDGPLWPARDRAVEAWTEAELCGLHALWGLASRRGRDDWVRRCDRARDWHLENTQPDNATNRPWALHVFLLAGTAEGRLYAETLLHNAVVTAGRPDLLSAWILLDAARRLDAAGGLVADSGGAVASARNGDAR